MLIVLWGLSGEGTLSAVGEELCRLGAQVLVIDQRDVLNIEMNLCAGFEVGGMIRTPDAEMDLADITAMYLRPYDPRRLPHIAQAGPDSAAWWHAVVVEDMLLSWANTTPALVVNRPSAMTANNSKPYQLEHIRQLGFAVPDTLITTDPAAAQAFWEHHGSVVYKSVSGTRSIVTCLGPDQMSRLGDIVWCPTQFQQYIAGRDYRAHVVGKEVFACEVITDAIDYRYPGSLGVELHPYRLPIDVEDRCRLLAERMQLSVAGIDLRRTPQGEWYCFEVNPSPGFTYFQTGSGQPMSRAIARLLAAG